MSAGSLNQRKTLLYQRTKDLFTNYTRFAILNLNNITSNQLQLAKRQWHGKAEFLFGKNTTITKALRELNMEDIVDKIKGNVAFVFTNENIKDIKKILEENSRDTNAKVGAIAQKDVFIDKQVTGMGPDKTSFFQAMGISTKITKGKVEIIQSSHVLRVGEKVTPSQANLLNIMEIMPFTYAVKMESIYDHGFYEPWIADITDNDIDSIMKNTISELTALALGINEPTKTSAPFMARNVLKDAFCLSLSLNLENKLTKTAN